MFREAANQPIEEGRARDAGETPAVPGAQAPPVLSLGRAYALPRPC
jgi:hypothetical protein